MENKKIKIQENTLDFSNLIITNKTISNITHELKNCISLYNSSHIKKTIINLCVNNTTLDNNGIMFLFKIMTTPMFQHINLINLSNSNIGDEGVSLLSILLRIQHEWLNLNNNSIGSAGTLSLSTILRYRSTNIKSLDLSNNRIEDEGGKYIGNMLGDNSSLVSLSLCHCGIGLIGIKSIANSLKKNNSLFQLDLSENWFGTQGVELLADSLYYNSSFHILDVSDANSIVQDDEKYIGTIISEILSSMNTNNPIIFKLINNFKFRHSITNDLTNKLKADMLELSDVQMDEDLSLSFRKFEASKQSELMVIENIISMTEVTIQRPEKTLCFFSVHDMTKTVRLPC